MIICPDCGHCNRVGTLFCEECGKSLEGHPTDSGLPTVRLPESADEPVAQVKRPAAEGPGGTRLKLLVQGEVTPIAVTVSGPVVLGRADISNSRGPDVDLEPFGAVAKGVSRQHAIIELREGVFVIEDTESANGTYLNGHRLAPHQPHVVRDGDELRLGKLIAHIYLE